MKKEELIKDAEIIQAEEQEKNQSEEVEPVKLEKIFLWKDNKEYKDDLFVSVNGENYQLKRGMELEVPYYVAEVIRNSNAQDMRAMEAGAEFKE